MPPWTLLAAALAFAFADRFAGGAYVTALRTKAEAVANRWPTWEAKTADAILNARAVVWATAVLALALAVLGAFTRYGPGLSILALGFAGWRWDGWITFGGGIDPKTSAECVGLFERHALAIPAFILPLLFLQHMHLMTALGDVLGLTVFASFATLLGAVLALTERPGFDVNAIIEAARGFVLGALVAIILI